MTCVDTWGMAAASIRRPPLLFERQVRELTGKCGADRGPASLAGIRSSPRGHVFAVERDDAILG